MIERYRALVRSLEERGLVDERPGRTADEAAAEGAAALPTAAGLLPAGREGLRRHRLRRAGRRRGGARPGPRGRGGRAAPPGRCWCPSEPRRGHGGDRGRGRARPRPRARRGPRPAGPRSIVVLVLVVALVLGWAASGGRRGYLDPEAVDPAGSKAVVQVLQQQGVEVVHRAEHRLPRPPRPPTARPCWSRSPTCCGGEQVDRLRSLPGDLVLVTPGGPQDWAEAIGQSGTTEVRERTPGCALREAVRAGRADTGGLLYTATDVPRDHGGALLHRRRPRLRARPRRGRPARSSCSAPPTSSPTTASTPTGNAALALNLLGRADSLVWYLPVPEAGADGPSLGSLVPDGVRFALIQVALGVILLALWRARRLGRVVAEPLPVEIRASEAVEGRGRLLRRARATDRAALALRTATLARLRGPLGLPRSTDSAADRAAVVAAVAARTGRPQAEVADPALRRSPRRRPRVGASRRRTRPTRPRGAPPVTDTAPEAFPAEPGPGAPPDAAREAAGGPARRGRQGRRRPGRRRHRPGDRAALPRPRAARGRARGRPRRCWCAPSPRRCRLDTKRVQFTPDLMPGDVTGSLVYDARDRRVRVPRGPGLHQPAARRRDQPDAAEDPGRAARGDGGAPGLGRRRARGRCPTRSWSRPPRTRSSTRAPTRCRRPSSTASCSSSTLPLPGARRRARGAAAPRRRLRPARPRRGRRPPGRRRRRPRRAAARPCAPVHGRRRGARLHRRPRPGHPAVARRCSSACRPAGPPRCSRAARAWAWLSGRDYVTPDDVKALARPDPAPPPPAAARGRAGGRRPPTACWTPCSPPSPSPAERAAVPLMALTGRLGLLAILAAVAVGLRGAVVGRRARRYGRPARPGRASTSRWPASPRALTLRRTGATADPARRRRPTSCWRSATRTGDGGPRGRVRDAWPPSAGVADRPVTPLDLPPGERRRLTTTLRPTRRGDRAGDRVTVRSLGPLGLAARQALAGRARGRVRVLPPFGSRKHLPSRLARLRELDGRTAVDGPRPGHRVRLAARVRASATTCARSTGGRSARAADVVVRTWRPERDRRVLLVLDTGRTSAGRVGDGPRLDAAMDAALLLAALASRAGDRVDLLAYDRRVRADVARRRGVRAAARPHPGDGPPRAGARRDRLRGARRRRSCAAAASAPSWCCSSALDPARGRARGCCRCCGLLTARHQVVLASVADPESTCSPPGAAPRTAVYDAASAERARGDREAVRETLTRRGVDVVDGDPDQLPPRLADAYLALKAAGRL